MKLEDKSIEEKMKYVEIHSEFESNTTDLSQTQAIELSKTFIECSIETKDFRYLNTALKLNDLLREQMLSEEFESTELNRLEKRGIRELRAFVDLA